MIAIKGMDMPKNLQECRFKMVSHKSICCLIDGSVRELNGKTQMKFLPICSNCTMFPYESLPEENKDMSEKEIIECLAQAYCFKENELKPLDADLIKSMAQNILKLQNKKALIGDER